MQDIHTRRLSAMRQTRRWVCAMAVMGWLCAGTPAWGQTDDGGWSAAEKAEAEVIEEVEAVLEVVRGAGALETVEPAAVARPLARGLAMLNSLESHLQRVAEREQGSPRRDPAQIVGRTVRARLLRAELYLQAARAVDPTAKARGIFEDRADAAYQAAGRVAPGEPARAAAAIGRLRVAVMTGGRTRPVAGARDAARAAVLRLPAEQRDLWRQWLALAEWRLRLQRGTPPEAGELRALLRDTTMQPAVRGQMVWLALAAGASVPDAALIDLLRHPLVVAAAPSLPRLTMLHNAVTANQEPGEARTLTLSERVTLARQSLVAGRIDRAYAVQPAVTLTDLLADSKVEPGRQMAMRMALLRRAVAAGDEGRIALLLADVDELRPDAVGGDPVWAGAALGRLPTEMLWLIVRARLDGFASEALPLPPLEQLLIVVSDSAAPAELRRSALRLGVARAADDAERVVQLLSDRPIIEDDPWLLTAEALAWWRRGEQAPAGEWREIIEEKLRRAYRAALEAEDSRLLGRLAVVNAMMQANAEDGSLEKALQILNHAQRHTDASAEVRPIATRLAVSWLLRLGRNDEAAARLAAQESAAVGLGRLLDVTEALLDRPQQTPAVRQRIARLLAEAISDYRAVTEADWVRLATLASRAGAHEMVVRVYRDAPPQVWDEAELAWAAAIAFAAEGNDKRASQIITRQIGYDDPEAMLGRVDDFVRVGSDQVAGWLLDATRELVGVSSPLWPDLQLRLAEWQARQGESEAASGTLRRAELLRPDFRNDARRERIEAVEKMIQSDGPATENPTPTDTPTGGQI